MDKHPAQSIDVRCRRRKLSATIHVDDLSHVLLKFLAKDAADAEGARLTCDARERAAARSSATMPVDSASS